MTRCRGCVFRLRAVAGALALLCSHRQALAQAQASQREQPPFQIVDHFEPLASAPDRGDVLSTLRPIVRQFDFDQQDTGPNSLPPNFFRYVAPSQGFPPFGSVRIARGEGYVADGANDPNASALEFQLEGGSMSARIASSVAPVLPYADYIVACRVRTRDLVHARARLVAWLCDAAGRIIPASRVESRGANTSGRWETLSLEMHGNFADAADLIFELQLFQPGTQETPPAAALAGDRDAIVHDTRGWAWFDDVTISHLPRVVLGMTRAGNVITAGDPAEFAVQVNELAADDLQTRLRIFDVDGAAVVDRAFPAPRGRQTTSVSVPLERSGWYRAVLDVTSHEYVGRRRWIDLVVLPKSPRAAQRESPFGVVFDHTPGSAAALDAAMTSRMRAGLAIVPAWDQHTTLKLLPQAAPARRQMVEQLLRNNIDVAFQLQQTPDELARAAGASARTTLQVLAGDSHLWRPYIDDLLMHFGLTINRWIIGSREDIAGGDTQETMRQVSAARQAFAAFVPSPQLHLTWPVEQQVDDAAGPSAVALDVPSVMPASSIAEFLTPWLASPGVSGASRSTITMINLLPANKYTPRQRMIDALQRGLCAWRAGAPAIVIAQPWHSAGDGADRLMPEPVFAAWHTLASQLTGRHFVSELPLGPDIHVWAARGQDADDAALIAWCDRESSAGPLGIDIQLADRAVQVYDAFGNATTIEPRNGLCHLQLTEMPVFVQGVSLELVLFRSGVSIQPNFIPAASKVHEHQVVIHNPWDAMVAGTIRLTSEADLQVSPAVQEFAIAPRGEARLPLQIVPQRGILAGHKIITAEISINADRLHTLRMDLEIDVGLKDIELNATWTALRNPQTGVDDLLISPAITNRMTRPVNLDVDLLAEGVSQMRRTIAGLQPGQTQTRTFRIPNGVALLAGKQIRLGVAQRDGVARLNRVITIQESVRSQGSGISALTPDS